MHLQQQPVGSSAHTHALLGARSDGRDTLRGRELASGTSAGHSLREKPLAAALKTLDARRERETRRPPRGHWGRAAMSQTTVVSVTTRISSATAPPAPRAAVKGERRRPRPRLPFAARPVALVTHRVHCVRVQRSGLVCLTRCRLLSDGDKAWCWSVLPVYRALFSAKVFYRACRHGP